MQKFSASLSLQNVFGFKWSNPEITFSGGFMFILKGCVLQTTDVLIISEVEELMWSHKLCKLNSNLVKSGI